MTATVASVVSLDSHRRNRPPTCGCPRHRLEALTARAPQELAGTEAELLIDRQTMAGLVDDLVTTVRAAIETNRERTTP
jgi:hypothetical protein